MTKRLLIRIDSGFDVGHGHAVRVDGLLQSVETPVQPVVWGDTTNLPGTLSGAETIEIKNLHPTDITAVRADALLVDLPQRANFPWALASRLGMPVIAIDDEGGDVEADLIVNPAAFDGSCRYRRAAPGTRLLRGPRYALVRPAFSVRSWRAPLKKQILIVVGSGERAAGWARKLLTAFPFGLQIDDCRIVVGAAFPDIGAFLVSARAAGIEVLQGIDAPQLAKLMANASVALVTGGMVVPEALTVGVPVIAFPQVENLVPEMQWLGSYGCIADLGFERGMDMDAVGHDLAELIEDKDLAMRQSMLGRRLFDGSGMQRVASAIDDVLAGRIASVTAGAPV